MQLVAFRIKNFRSIIDTNWINFSKDSVTVFVGQNESGKSTILDALHLALSTESPSEDDYRTGLPSPTVQIRAHIEYEDLKSELEKYRHVDRESVRKFIDEKDGLLEIDCIWSKTKNGSLSPDATMVTDDLIRIGNSSSVKENQENTVVVREASTNSIIEFASEILDPENKETLDPEDFAGIIWRQLPTAVKFDESSGNLPNSVDIDSNGNLVGAGADAANNFLRIAGINLPELIKSDKRSQSTILNRANNFISSDFNSFWTQTIGKDGKVSLKCEIDKYDFTNEEKAGRSHLVFWISDGTNQLYPKQRSKGMSWFISFYLQLKASEKEGFSRLFLLDEPGANLHSKAQGDVLELINKIAKKTCAVVYSTHSPQFLEYSKLYRVFAVQRDGDSEDNPTLVIDAHRLGTASSDTLSPLLMAMGADLSHQEVVKKNNNILLEEMSGFYYLKSFWKMTKQNKEANFIAATGAGKVTPLANMFLGWGLNFIVVVDDDSQGRDVYNNLLRYMFGDDRDLADQNIMKITGCSGIEDIFSKSDLISYILKDETVSFTGKNSDFLKKGYSKPVLAYQFYLEVQNGKITLSSFDDETKAKIIKTVEGISTRLI